MKSFISRSWSTIFATDIVLFIAMGAMFFPPILRLGEVIRIGDAVSAVALLLLMSTGIIRTRPLVRHPYDVVFLAWVAAIGLGWLHTLVVEPASASTALKSVVKLSLAFLPYIAVRISNLTMRSTNRVIAVYGAILAVVAIMQRCIPATNTVLDLLGYDVPGAAFRATSLVGNPNMLAFLLVFASISLASILNEKTTSPRLRWLFVGLAAALAGWALGLTASRTGWVVYLVVAGTLLLRYRRISVLFLILVTVGTLGASSGQAVVQRFAYTTFGTRPTVVESRPGVHVEEEPVQTSEPVPVGPTDEGEDARTTLVSRLDASTAGRFYLWQAAWDVIMTKPITGWGYGRMSEVLYDYYPADATVSLAPGRYFPHNSLLLVWGELGVPGLLLYLAVMMAPIVCSRGWAVRAQLGAATVALFTIGLAADVAYSVMVMTVFLMMVAAAINESVHPYGAATADENVAA